ncbi:ribonuclease III [Solitalea koreensis]|uniref:Ribonuclease 3 n=1 Tax=Solitalea koreensis TaxID=543615 RepID=A0A521AYA2_9SPHI|nr:ribonuclease III [Solitalea koreensis]SMO39804.1 ribonuclease-3 [Solitalea koreensis]
MPALKLYRLYISRDRKYARVLHNMLGFVPRNLSLYKLAFRHKSVAPQLKEGLKNSNERLEFLGDAVLGAIVGEMLFKKYPYRDEGFLTEMRSKIVNRNHLNQLARKIGIGDLMDYDSRMIHNPIKQGSLMGDAFEALVGAIYLDQGYVFTKEFILKRILKPHVDVDALEQTETNFKSKLIEWCQRHGKEVLFELMPNEEGARTKLFTVKVFVDNEECGTGQDFTKKNAEKTAAEHACALLGL